MKRGDAWLVAVFAGLALVVAAAATRVAGQLERGGAWRLELSSTPTATLSDATRDRLAALEEKVLVTYAVSDEAAMPSAFKRLERSVVDLLESMRRVAPERFDYLILDPETAPELADFAARRRLSPRRVRTVQGDAWTETEVWSSLSIAYGARPAAILHGIGPEHLERLQDTLVAQLDQLESPRRARFGLVAPAGFAQLESELADLGEVLRLEPVVGAPGPRGGWLQDVDVLFWMQPGAIDPALVEDLELHLADGRSAVVAGGLLRARPDALVGLRTDDDGALQPAIHFEEALGDLPALLAAHGLRPVRGLVCDARADAVVFEEAPVPAPFLVRCIAPNQDFQSWQRLPNGTLLFTAPTPFELDEDVLAARGLQARVLATSSDGTWIQAPPLDPAAPLALQDLAPENGIAAPKLPLAVEIVGDDPWRGAALFFAQTTPFEDGLLAREGTAHANLVRALVEEVASDERLVLTSAVPRRVNVLTALSPGGRLIARAIVLGLPLAGLGLLTLILSWRGRARGAARSGTRLALQRISLAAGLLVAAPLALAAAGRLTGALPLSADLTEERLHGLAPGTRDLARRAGEDGRPPLEAELLFSRASALPPELRPRLRRLEELLASLRRAGAPLETKRVFPEDLGPAEREALEARGLPQVRTTDRDEERLTVRSFTAGLRLARGDRSTLLRFDEPLAFEELEFRLAFALWRLETGRAPTVAFASDVPRPSAAEAYENFQSKGLFAPTGVDVYAAARARLAGLDLDVVHVNPRAPQLPEEVDLLVWLQPRRSIAPMLEAAARHLVGGGDLLLAAQHFRIQARQYRGAGFEGVLWPQPQSPDLEHLWLPDLGIDLVREVLFDARHTTLGVEAQVVGRDARAVLETQELALPFLLRADAAGFDPTHPITRQLGDQAFVFGSEIRWDDARLEELGLTARSLIQTSSDAWSFAWKGGWIPTEFLEGPAPELEGGGPASGPRVLAALFEGRFPVPAGHLVLNPPRDEAGELLPPPVRDDWPTSQTGRLLLVGGSEPFTDARLLDPDFRGDQLLVNSVLHLALPADLAAVAQRRDVTRGFGLVTDEERTRWRALVLAGGPGLACLVALAGWLLRRRAEALP